MIKRALYADAKSTISLALRGAIVAALSLSATACMSLANEEGRLPDVMRSAITGLTARGYPDLTKIPDAPTDLPTARTWSSLEARLVQQGATLRANPLATAPTADDINLEWAAQAQAGLEADPRAQALPPVVAGSPGTPEWAAQERAKLDADLARLPPL